MNLVTNATEAIKGQGKIKIVTATAILNTRYQVTINFVKVIMSRCRYPIPVLVFLERTLTGYLNRFTRKR